MTRERVRQIEAKAVRKLQNPVRAQVLEGFVPDSDLLGTALSPKQQNERSENPTEKNETKTDLPNGENPTEIPFGLNEPAFEAQPEPPSGAVGFEPIGSPNEIELQGQLELEYQSQQQPETVQSPGMLPSLLDIRVN